VSEPAHSHFKRSLGQPIALFLNGFIPLVGPGGMFVSFVINLFHIVGVLIAESFKL
jgi:hypothetical protein